MIACARGRVDLVRLLLQAESYDIEATDTYFELTALMYVAHNFLVTRKYNPSVYEGNDYDSEQVCVSIRNLL